MTFLCLMRRLDTSVEVRILHRMMRYFELPRAYGAVWTLVWACY
jgi:hypothetical protein